MSDLGRLGEEEGVMFGLCDCLPKNPEGHFRLLFFAAVARVLDHLCRLEGAEEAGEANATRLTDTYSFLHGYADEMRAAGVPPHADADWWRVQIRRFEAHCPAHLPLRALSLALSLEPDALTALILAGVVEEDIRFGALFAALQDPLASRRPCFGLLGALLGPETGDTWAVLSPLLTAGMLSVENGTAPRAEWVPRVPSMLWDALRGRRPHPSGGIEFQSRYGFKPLRKLILDPVLRSRLRALPRLLARGDLDAVLLRGMNESGRRTIFGAVARVLRRDVLFSDRTRTVAGNASHVETGDDAWPLLGPLCTLTGAFPVIALDPAPGETIELSSLPGYRGPVGIVLRREGGVSGSLVERSLVLHVPPATRGQRLGMWRGVLRHIGPVDETALEEIADGFLLPLGTIRRAAEVATAYAALEGRNFVLRADVQEASRSLGRQALDTLAQRVGVGRTGGWGQLVVGESTTLDLYDLERRCHHRERLLDNLGVAFGGGANRGVRALFNGPSGTGKTLAASVLGAVLQMDVYRVDLASVVNKYIGETEKNLSLLLSRAEELDVILLIDEGDSLMAGRTDVKSANDRYANLETNYLLQRLESYEGIVLVTTNSSNRIDEAFLRRFDVVVEFLPPGPPERLELWRVHLPLENAVPPSFLRDVAQLCALTGGQIRNAALYAALLSVDGGREQVEADDVEAAVRREYRKIGASCPLRREPSDTGRHTALQDFLSEIH